MNGVIRYLDGSVFTPNLNNSAKIIATPGEAD